jgi:hypothetical protein
MLVIARWRVGSQDALDPPPSDSLRHFFRVYVTSMNLTSWPPVSGIFM